VNVFKITLALSVNNLFEEKRKTDAEFIFLLFPHKGKEIELHNSDGEKDIAMCLS
jgi:hypothetical protein